MTFAALFQGNGLFILFSYLVAALLLPALWEISRRGRNRDLKQLEKLEQQQRDMMDKTP